jgi:hypothetical protein
MRPETTSVHQLALVYAVQMCVGVNITGTIGCGKTETKTATAHALGVPCGVILASDATPPQVCVRP